MAHEGNRSSQNSDDRQDQRASKAVPPGITHGISPEVPCPETVLVAVMTDGSYLLMGYPQREPAAFVIAENAGPLRQALQGVFGSPMDAALIGNGNGKHTDAVPPEQKAIQP